MNSKVTVLSDEKTGAVVNQSENNADYGFIRVQQQRTMIDDNGFLRRKSISAHQCFYLLTASTSSTKLGYQDLEYL